MVVKVSPGLRLELAKLLLGLGWVIVMQLHGDVQENGGILGGKVAVVLGTCQRTPEMCVGCQWLTWAEDCHPLLMYMNVHNRV